MRRMALLQPAASLLVDGAYTEANSYATVKTENLVRALEEAATQLGLEIRWEEGRFQGGRCSVNGEDVIILNRRHPAEAHLAILAASLQGLPLDAIYVRPAVREAILKGALAAQPSQDADVA